MAGFADLVDAPSGGGFHALIDPPAPRRQSAPDSGPPAFQTNDPASMRATIAASNDPQKDELLAAFDHQFPQGPTAGAGRGTTPASAYQQPAQAPSAQSPSAPAQSAPNPIGDAPNPLSLAAHVATGFGSAVAGGYRGLATLLTGGGLDKAVQNINDTQQKYTYNAPAGTPDAQMEHDFASNYNPLNWPAAAGAYLGGKAADAGYPMAGAAITGAGAVAPMLLGMDSVKAPIRSLIKGPEPIAPRIEPTMGAPEPPATSNPIQLPSGEPAAGTPTAKPVDVSAASPELQAAVAQATAKGQPISGPVLQRHVVADTLPVPIKLTAGQATLDPELISREMNGRGKVAPLVSPDFYNAQGKALAANVDALRTSVAPDVPQTPNPTALGQTLVDAYKAKDAPIQADIASKYKALEEANGGQFPIDGKALAQNVDAALSKALKSGSVPADLQASLNEFKNGRQMTFEDFETLRSDAADAMRTSSDGRARAAASIIRQQLENMPLSPEAAALKPMADAARSAAKARFDALDADPAYKAAVGDGVPVGEPSPLADKFVPGYVINGRYANVLKMADNLSHDAVAKQVLGAAVVDNLKTAGKVDPQTGNFTQDGFNKTVRAMGPKLDTLLGNSGAELARRIGDTAKLTQAQPRGSYVNNSNTLVGTLAEGAKSGLEGAANVAAHGVPIGTWIRKGLQSASAKKAAQQSTAPGAGMTKLSDLPGIKPD